MYYGYSLGEFVCDFPGELASYSAQELAALAHVSKATVTRFIQRLGYETYEEARRHARRKADRLTVVPDDNRRRVHHQSVNAHVARGIANLEATSLGISDNQIEAAAQATMQARKVWVLGFRSSQPFASYLQWQLTQVIEDIIVIPGSGQMLGEHLVSLREHDVVVFFAMRRRIAQIRKAKVKLISITDEGASFENSAGRHFQCQSLAPGPLFNHTAVMALCHLLITRCLEKAGVEGHKRLRHIEALNEALDEL